MWENDGDQDWKYLCHDRRAESPTLHLIETEGDSVWVELYPLDRTTALVISRNSWTCPVIESGYYEWEQNLSIRVVGIAGDDEEERGAVFVTGNACGNGLLFKLNPGDTLYAKMPPKEGYAVITLLGVGSDGTANFGLCRSKRMPTENQLGKLMTGEVVRE